MLRSLYEVLCVEESTDSAHIKERLEQLHRGLEPENEFSLIISWLGRCNLVHKLGQEQLPIGSEKKSKVPDLLAYFRVADREVPVLIEVKTTSTGRGLLKIERKYVTYAERLNLPLLIAWKYLDFWMLFDVHVGEKTEGGHYEFSFMHALEHSLLSALAGDFCYRVVPGTAIRMQIKAQSPPDAPEGFDGVLEDIHFENASGERIPHIQHLSELFHLYPNDAEVCIDGNSVVQRFVINDEGLGEFASRTLGAVLNAFSNFSKTRFEWRKLAHNTEHWVHNSGSFRKIVEDGAKYGVFTPPLRFHPKSLPAWLEGD